MSILDTANKVGQETGALGARLDSLLAHRVVDKLGNVKLNGDDLATSLANLLASSGAASAIATLITGSDLTVSGTLTTLATNVGTNTTQGAALFTALVARATTANAASLKALSDIATTSTPTTGGTVTAGTGKVNETLYLTPAGTLATLTVAFPSDANSQVGQMLRVFSTQIVTALTVSASGLTIQGTALTALAANTPYTFQKVAAATWIRLQ